MWDKESVCVHMCACASLISWSPKYLEAPVCLCFICSLKKGKKKGKKKSVNNAFEITQGIGEMISEAESYEFKAAALSFL